MARIVVGIIKEWEIEAMSYKLLRNSNSILRLADKACIPPDDEPNKTVKTATISARNDCGNGSELEAKPAKGNCQ